MIGIYPLKPNKERDRTKYFAFPQVIFEAEASDQSTVTLTGQIFQKLQIVFCFRYVALTLFLISGVVFYLDTTLESKCSSSTYHLHTVIFWRHSSQPADTKGYHFILLILYKFSQTFCRKLTIHRSIHFQEIRSGPEPNQITQDTQKLM